MELLNLALALLIAAQGVNVPPELKNQAITVALYAIQVSQTVIIEEKRIQAENLTGGLIPTSTSPIQVPQQSILEAKKGSIRWSPNDRHGCEYSRPAGSGSTIQKGFKISCPQTI